MDIYIKPDKKATVKNKNTVVMKDIAEVVAPKEAENGIKEIEILKKGKENNYLVSVSDLVNMILAKYPQASVINLGEMDTWIQFETNKKKNKFKDFITVTAICCTLAIGSSTAIMSYQSDGQVSKVFQKYYEIFFGEFKEKPYIIEIPYSIGLAAGIIVFFNHFGGKKLTDDPTPIEVEMTTYKANIEDTVINELATNKNKKDSTDK